jgi:hypothetical protein
MHNSSISLHNEAQEIPLALSMHSAPLEPASSANSSLGHLAECAGPQATLFRAHLRRDILAVLHSAPQTDSWCHQFGMLDLRAMLLRLFPIASSAPADEQHKHFTRLLCGAFSVRHANLAAKALGFPSADDGRLTLQRIRLTCFDRVAQVSAASNSPCRAVLLGLKTKKKEKTKKNSHPP